MSKISLKNIEGGFNLSRINDNFDRIEGVINDQVLFRDNPKGEPNQIKQNLDMNGKDIINVRKIQVTQSFEIEGLDLATEVAKAEDAAIVATIANEAAQEALVEANQAYVLSQQAITQANDAIDLAEASANQASASQVAALASEVGAADSALEALGYKNDAEAAALASEASAVNSEVSAQEAQTALESTQEGVDNFLKIYQVLSSAPTVRYDGSPLEKGDMYYNESEDTLYLYSGSSTGWRPTGRGGDVPVSTIIMSANSSPPIGYISMGDYLFENALYPQLAESLAGKWNRVDDPITHTRLVNISGAFPRFMNTGGTVDAGRTVGSWQEDAFQGHLFTKTLFVSQSPGQFTVTTGAGTGHALDNVGTPRSDGMNGTPRVANETRGKNVAFYGYIKAWDVAVTPATIDVQALVNQNEAFPTRYRHGRNMLVNGGFTTCVYYNVTALFDYVLDQWRSSASGGSRNTARVYSTTAATGYALRATTVAVTGTAANRFVGISTPVEAYRIREAMTQASVVSFTVSASIAGKYSFVVHKYNAANELVDTFIQTYTIPTANTKVRITLNIPALNTSVVGGAWGTGASRGCGMSWNFSAGSTLTTSTIGSWAGGYYVAGSGTTDLANTVNAWFEIEDVQWEVGNVATPFEVLSETASELECMRYYQVFHWLSTRYGNATGDKEVTYPLTPYMRANPSVSFLNAYNGTYKSAGSNRFFALRSNAIPANDVLGAEQVRVDARL
jgi:hypothetical protein